MSELSITAMLDKFLATRYTPEEVQRLCLNIMAKDNAVFVHYEPDYKAFVRVNKYGSIVSLFTDSFVVSWAESFMPVQHLFSCYDQSRNPVSLEFAARLLIGVNVPTDKSLSPLQQAILLRDVVQAMADGNPVIHF